MAFLTYEGTRQRDPKVALRLTRPDGSSVIVLDLPDDRTATLAERYPDARLHGDRDTAIADALERADA